MQHLSNAEREQLLRESFNRRAFVVVIEKCLGIGILVAILIGMLSRYLFDTLGVRPNLMNPVLPGS
ncbi:MAG: hypothetical protein ACE37H_16675 [Phycisphaeraceae bacterium]